MQKESNDGKLYTCINGSYITLTLFYIVLPVLFNFRRLVDKLLTEQGLCLQAEQPG